LALSERWDLFLGTDSNMPKHTSYIKRTSASPASVGGKDLQFPVLFQI